MQKKKLAIEYSEYDSIDECPEEIRSLLLKAYDSAAKAYAPYSGFQVGAALKLKNAGVILGNNQENMAYPTGLCAERVTLYAASANHPEDKMEAIAISSTSKADVFSPCGSCRQAMAEMEAKNNGPIKIYLWTPESKVRVFDGVDQLLPFSFKNESLRDHDKK